MAILSPQVPEELPHKIGIYFGFGRESIQIKNSIWIQRMNSVEHIRNETFFSETLLADLAPLASIFGGGGNFSN